MRCSRRFIVPWVAAALLTTLFVTRSAHAQTPATKPAGSIAAAPHALLTGTPDTLWLLNVEPDRTTVFQRGLSGDFQKAASLKAAIRKAVGGARRLYVFTTEGQFLSLATFDSQWSPELDLPNRGMPVDAMEASTGLYAIVKSPEPGTLPVLVEDKEPNTATQPYEPHGAPLSLLRYDHLGWSGVEPCPDEVTAGTNPEMRPRLAIVRDHACLLWWSPSKEQLMWSHVKLDEGTWSSPSPLPVGTGIQAFWVARVAGVATLLVERGAKDGGDELVAYRFLAGTDVANGSWRKTAVQWSALPAGVTAQEYVSAAGFNQHLTMLLRDTQGQSYLQFGRIGAAPAEKSLSVQQVFEGQKPQPGPAWVQAVTMLVLFALLFALIIFRRGAMVRALPLPKGAAPAFTFQRLIGLAIDFIPFALIFAAIFGVDLKTGAREVIGWAVGEDMGAVGLPPPDILFWWCISCGAYVLYSLILEMITGRTIGKVVSGTRVIGESGKPATILQILIRNLLRAVELVPPLWILSFLVVLSRNRQRMGDIFAHTVVVRRVPVRQEPNKPNGPKQQ